MHFFSLEKTTNLLFTPKEINPRKLLLFSNEQLILNIIPWVVQNNLQLIIDQENIPEPQIPLGKGWEKRVYTVGLSTSFWGYLAID